MPYMEYLADESTLCPSLHGLVAKVHEFPGLAAETAVALVEVFDVRTGCGNIWHW